MGDTEFEPAGVRQWAEQESPTEVEALRWGILDDVRTFWIERVGWDDAVIAQLVGFAHAL